MIEIVINILIVLVILGFLITIHELGHFLAAKYFGVKVEAFAIGLGPKLWAKKYKGTEYRLNVFPLGGYVKILGEGDEVVDKKKASDKGNFKNISKWKQIVILLAGVTVNLLFAVTMYYIFIASNSFKWYLGEDVRDINLVVGSIGIERFGDVKYIEVVDGSGAKRANMPESGGTIVSVDGKKLEYSYEFRDYVMGKKGEDVNLNICSESLCSDYTVNVSDEGKVGISMPVNYSVYLDYTEDKLISGFGHGLNLLSLVSEKLSQLFSEAKESGDYSNVANNISGPIGIYIVVEAFKKYGIVTLLGLTADLSFTLAIMNSLPIPALDGGRVLLTVLEKISGRFWSRRLEAWAINLSFLLLLLLMVVVVFKDIILFQDLRELFAI